MARLSQAVSHSSQASICKIFEFANPNLRKRLRRQNAKVAFLMHNKFVAKNFEKSKILQIPGIK